MTASLPLMKSAFTPLPRSVLLPLGLAVDAAIQNKVYGLGTTALTISNDEMEDTIKIVKSLEEWRLLIKWISETIKNEAKERKVGFLPMLLGTLAASILGSVLTGRAVIRAGENF